MQRERMRNIATLEVWHLPMVVSKLRIGGHILAAASLNTIAGAKTLTLRVVDYERVSGYRCSGINPNRTEVRASSFSSLATRLVA
jgi:hypothetical protein